MESVDVHDLPEEEARLVAEFVKFLRRRKLRQHAAYGGTEEQPLTETTFAVWPLAVKGTLSREEIYDHL